jgi:hypothetical protein
VVIAIERQRLGDMTDADARAEGYADFEKHKQIVPRMHANMTWNDDGVVWIHTFKRAA